MIDMRKGTCSIEGCERPRHARGWCSTHYSRWYEARPALPRPTAEDRFWSRVLYDGDCWIWTGARNDSGYGQLVVDRNRVYTHRFAYELLVGPIPEGLHLDHLCRNPPCCNPAHLEPVAPIENVRRGLAGPKTHCFMGHPFDAANTYIRKDSGQKMCRACCARRQRERKAGAA